MEIVFLIIAALFILLIVKGIAMGRAQKRIALEAGADPKKIISAGKYIGGHPDIDKAALANLLPSRDSLIILSFGKKAGEIPNSSIKNILIEDASTVERRVTAGRLLMVGVFAFGMKKKTKHELAYVTIEWNDGKFDHQTIFETQGLGAMNKANTIRNKLIKATRQA